MKTTCGFHWVSKVMHVTNLSTFDRLLSSLNINEFEKINPTRPLNYNLKAEAVIGCNKNSTSCPSVGKVKVKRNGFPRWQSLN